MTTLFQNNDQVIITEIRKNGVKVELASIVSAMYRVYSNDLASVLIDKSLGNGIYKDGGSLRIDISAADCVSLRGIYYHELTVTDASGKKSTAFKQTVLFESTEN